MLKKQLLALPFAILIAKAATALNPGNFEYAIPIKLSDTTGISQIEITLGSAENSSDLLQYNFIYDQKTGLPNGLVYRREGTMLNLTLGNYPLHQAMYGEYKIIKNGQAVETRKFYYK